MTTPIPTGTWNVDPSHSRVGFTARHMMVSKVRGSFDDFTADIAIGETPSESQVTATVQMASVNTGSDDRDNHLRTNDFFDVDTHPTMTFTSSTIREQGGDFALIGELTIKGVTRTVEFDLEFDGSGQDPWGGTRAGFTATTEIDRREFGVEFNAPLETGGVLVGDKVKIELDIQLVKA